MTLPRRSALRILPALALAAARPAHANVTGNLELQSHTTQNLARGADASPSTLLLETLSLRWAGLPFGPAVAVATLGGGISNVSGWMGDGVRTDGRVVSFDGSLGLLPRRAVPLRVYASGSLEAGTGGALASHGAGPTLLYGGALSLEPGALPGLRVDASEARASRPGHPDLSDAQRRLVASSWGTVARQRVNLALRAEDDRRAGAGDVTSLGGTLAVSSAPHQTTLVASSVRRSVPSLAGITSDRALGASSDQRWSRALGTQLGGRWADARAAGAVGSVADLRAGVTWAPLAGAQQLTLSGGGGAGLTRTTAAGVEGDGESYEASARVGWAGPLRRLTAGLALGTAVAACDCTFGNEGTSTLVDATASLGLPASARRSGQSSYTLVRAFAPLARGGDRLEHHARASGRLVLGAGTLTASLSYDDAVRDLLDITAARAATLHERAVGGQLGVARDLGGVSLSGELRHTRGRILAEGSPFFARTARQARTLTSGQAGLAWRPRHDVGVQAQAIGTWTTLEDSSSIGSFGANAALGWRLGRITASLQYQALRVELAGAESSFQHSVRTVVGRPFDL